MIQRPAPGTVGWDCARGSGVSTTTVIWVQERTTNAAVIAVTITPATGPRTDAALDADVDEAAAELPPPSAPLMAEVARLFIDDRMGTLLCSRPIWSACF